MSSIQVNNIKNANGTSAIAIDSSGVATFSKTLVPSQSMMYRNLIINGDMRIAQRGTSVSSKTAGGYFTVDRWTSSIGAAGTWTISQDTDVPSGQGFSNSHKYDCTTANASLSASSSAVIIQNIEAQNLQHLKYGTSSAEQLTLSFWVKSNKTGTYIFELYQWDSNRFISKSYTINSADTWEKKTITIEGDTSGVIDNNNDKGLQVAWWLVAGSDNSSGTLQTTWASMVSANRAVGQVNLADSTSNYINITGVQLEVGDAATPFEHRPYDMELARCMRYFEKSGASVTPILSANEAGFLISNMYNNIVNNSYYADVFFKVIKRANPTVVTYPYTTPTNTGRWSNDVGTDYGASSATTPAGPKQWGFNVANQSGTTLTIGSQKIIIGNWYADAEL